MAATRGRRVALWAGTITVVVLVVAGFALKDRLWEELWIYKLENGDDGARKAAAIRLGAMKSARAVPALLRCMMKVPPPASDGVMFVDLELSDLEGLMEERKAAEWEQNWPGRALAAIGKAACRPLLEQVAARWRGILGSVIIDCGVVSWSYPDPTSMVDSGGYAWCEETILRIGMDALWVLEEGSKDRDPALRAAARNLLGKMRGAED